MFKKIITLLMLLNMSSAFSNEKFKGGVTFDFDKESNSKAEIIQNQLPVIDSKFVDLNYSINFKPLNLLSKDEFKKKKHFNKNYLKNANKIPDSYEVSLSMSKAKASYGNSSDIKNMLKNNDSDRELLFAYSIQLKNEKKYDEALKIANEITDVDPDFALAHFLRGDILRNMGKLKEAAEEYLYTAQLNPYCADAYYNIARILELTDNKELALDYYKTAYQINPNDTEIRDIILNGYMEL